MVMEAFTIATRLHLTSIAKEAINRAIQKYELSAQMGIDRHALTNLILNELGKETEEMIEVVRNFFARIG